jgi:hypothetical protein
MKDGIVEGCLGRERVGAVSQAAEAAKREIPKFGAEGRNKREEEAGRGAKKEFVLDVLGMVKSEFGGAEGFVKRECGIQEEEVQRLRALCVVECAPIHFVGVSEVG